jgi:hypothetical protein
VLKISTAEGNCKVRLKGRIINIYKIEENTKSFVYKNILNQRNRVTEKKTVLLKDCSRRKNAATTANRKTVNTKIFFLLRIPFIKQF